jgi:hypothetical protein
MRILFDDNTSVFFDLLDCDLAPIYGRIISHLRHLDIPFRDWDNPYNLKDPVTRLIEFGTRLKITVDRLRCEQKDQDYLNFLHEVYEKNYVTCPDPRWLDFHEQIHLCENFGASQCFLQIDYRDKAGLLEKPFDMSWLKSGKTRVRAGDVFVRWAELGKPPYIYWRDKEPDDITRIKELAKPWLKLRPMLLVALQDHDFGVSSDEFEQWWEQYHAEWCAHWNISKWDLVDMRSVLIFGRMSPEQLQMLSTLLINDCRPRRVTL